jgi:pimeloyl-ACP methyl ester carboxylesterase
VVWGREDPIAVPEIARQLERETPGAKLTWLDDLGHYPQAEDPQRWSAAVLAWLEDKE